MNNSEFIGGLLGLLIGAVIVLSIQLTIGNPFIYISDKIEDFIRNRKDKK